MLITYDPLYNSKSFHGSAAEAFDRVEDVIDLTERYYEKKGKIFEYQCNPYSGELPGVILFKIWPENPRLAKLLGKAKSIKMEQLYELESSKTRKFEDAGSGQESTIALPVRDRRRL